MFRTFTFGAVSGIIFLIVLFFFADTVQAQEPLTGNSPPSEILSETDSLTILESEALMTEFREQSKQNEYDRILSKQPRTAAEEQHHIFVLKQARQKLFAAKAETYRAKAKYCMYYATLTEDTKARQSARLHRKLAGEWGQRAVALLDNKPPTIEYSGRHELDLSRYGD